MKWKTVEVGLWAVTVKFMRAIRSLPAALSSSLCLWTVAPQVGGLPCSNALGSPEGSLRSSLHTDTRTTVNATGLPGGYLRSLLGASPRGRL